MYQRPVAVALGLILMSSGSAFASPANHLMADYGSVVVPFTHGVGNTFSGTPASGFTSQDGTPVTTALVGGKNYFYDDVVFTLPTAPEVSFDAAAVSIDLGSFLGLGNFSARLYKLDNGTASLTTGTPSSGTPIQSWTNTNMVSPGVSINTVLFQNVALTAGAAYALEFRGTIDGAFGGSYGGNLNITPVSGNLDVTPAVPEPDGAALLAAGLAFVFWIGRRHLVR